MQPTRMDLTMMSGSTQEFEFQLFSQNAPVDIGTETIDVYLAPGFGKRWKYQITSAPGQHLTPTQGVFRVAFTLPSYRSTQTWWYEVWRRTAAKPHIVGELQVIGSVRG